MVGIWRSERSQSSSVDSSDDDDAYDYERAAAYVNSNNFSCITDEREEGESGERGNDEGE